MKNPKIHKTIVYWSKLPDDGIPYEIQMFMGHKIEKISNISDLNINTMDMIKTRTDFYSFCPAHHESRLNLFKINFPETFSVQLDENGSIIQTDDKEMPLIVQTLGNKPHQKRFTIQLKCPMMFYSEDKNIELELFPPYLHKTVAQEYGHVTVGRYNIHFWPRIITMEMLLWPGVTYFKCHENDPAMYIKFHSKFPVELRQFQPTPLISRIANACSRASMFSPFKSLDERYKQFKKLKMEDQLLADIKANLLPK